MESMDIVEGRQPILELFAAGQPINQILVAKGERHGSIHKILGLARENKVIVKEVQRSHLDSISETKAHQGVVAYISPIKYWKLADLLAKDSNKLFLVLDEIQDPYNLGSLLRTAEACGVDGVIIPKRRAVGVTATVAKASAGAVSHIPICRVSNVVATLRELKEHGFWVAGADMDGVACYEQDLTGKLALVVGNEGKGLGRLVKETCDYLVKIPMQGALGSLNASVAGGILLYEIMRQKNTK